MADSCAAWRTNLAQRTPVYDQVFLKDYKPMDSPVVGRHQTEAWEDGTGDTHFFDRITVGQPNLQNRWQRIDASECGNACNPPRVFIGMGTERSEYFKEQIDLQSQTFCLTQLRHSTQPQQQIAEWMRKIKKLPEMYNTDFLRVHAVDFAPAVQIAGDDFATFTPIRDGVGANVGGQLTTINLGGTGNLPQSELTWPYMNYLTTTLQLEGYHEAPSGLPDGMFNFITDPRVWFKMTNGMDSIKDMMALTDPAQASPLYKVGIGVQKPFGNLVPTLDKRPLRFQHLGSGILNRVDPYINEPATTGTKPVVNPAYVNARYGLSYIWHPMAIKIWTAAFKKLNEKVPSVNSALYGSWQFINPQGLLQAAQPDGTLCTLNNDKQLYFYWLVALEMGFQYMYPEFLMPIIHLIDGSGKSEMVNQPVCGDAPQYVAQDYSNNPVVCEA